MLLNLYDLRIKLIPIIHETESHSITVPTFFFFFFFFQCLRTYKFCQYFKYISSKTRFIIRISCSTASQHPVLSMVPLYHRVVRLFMAFGSKTIESQEARCCLSSGMNFKAEHEAPCSATYLNGLNSERNPQSLAATVVLLLFYWIVIFLRFVLDKCFDTKSAKLKRDKTIIFCYHALQEVSHLKMKNWGPDATNTYITDLAFHTRLVSGN